MVSAPDQEKVRIFKIEPEEKGLRLDVYLSGRNRSISRSQIKRMIEEGQVLVNGTKAKPGYRLRVGEAVSYSEREAVSCEAVPEDIPLTILYEDKDLVVIDKPAGMVVHPAAGNYRGTLVNALLHHCRDFSGIGGVLRPGIVHRLDKDTSGLIVAAKNERTLNDLQNQFKEHRIKKAYKAIVFGDLPEDEGVIDAPVGRHPTDRKKMSTVGKKGKEALTRWRVRERYGILTLVDVRIETGRTHQIRVHFNAIGHPVVGDKVYGNSAKRIQTISPNVVQSKLKMLKRHALHAACLGFRHPALEEYVEFSTPLPPDMAGVVDFMRDYIKDKYGQDGNHSFVRKSEGG